MRARGRPKAAPTAENGPGALVRQSQARLWNRIRPKFLHTQGPVARREFRPATQILRAGNPTPSQRGNPRNGGPGVSGPMGTKCPSAASPGDPLVSFPSLGKKLAARRRRNIPLRGTKPLYHRPLIRPLRGHLPPRGKAFGGDRPLIRHGFAVPPSPQGEGLYEGIMKKGGPPWTTRTTCAGPWSWPPRRRPGPGAGRPGGGRGRRAGGLRHRPGR